MPHSAGKTNKQKHLIARTVLKKIFKKMFKKNSQGGKQEGPVFLSIERNSERIRKNMYLKKHLLKNSQSWEKQFVDPRSKP